ncbi:MAG: DUF421 domain-containing protein [Firmicutes bacterium]|nr:DUF421 domain-containing protein [Bacillota bacterium]
MAISFVRTIILYLLVIIVVRIMGKRQVGELEPIELVVTIMISELAAIPMQETGIPLTTGIVPIFTLLVLEVLLSFTEMKNKKIRRFIKGVPSILIYEGNMLIEEMKSIRFNRDDLMEELRLSGYANIADVQYGILETNGRLSVIPKKENKPLVQKDIDTMLQQQQQLTEQMQKKQKKEQEQKAKQKERLIKKQLENKRKD